MSDRLTTLPFELFEMIVLLAQSHPRTKPLYVSKAFLPFVRRPVFKVTKIKSYERLATFLELISLNEGVIPYIDIVSIELKGGVDVGKPTNKALRTGFAQLFATQILGIEYSTRIAKVILSPKDGRSLSSMHCLLIRDSFEGFRNPLDPSHYRSLEQYHSLHSFNLAITRDINDVGRERRGASSTSTDFTNWRIGYLGLEGPFVQNPRLVDFLSSFPGLLNLNLIELTTTGPSSLSPILEHLPSPQYLQLLALSSSHLRDAPEDLSHVLPHFSGLRILDLGAGTETFDNLNHSTFPKLTTLALRRGVGISIEQIKSLISGPKKLSNLVELELELVTRDPDFSSNSDYGYLPGYREEVGPVGIDHRVTAKALEEIVELADQEGLKVTGYAAEFARRETESRKDDSKGRSRWERRYELYVEDDWY